MQEKTLESVLGLDKLKEGGTCPLKTIDERELVGGREEDIVAPFGRSDSELKDVEPELSRQVNGVA